MIVIDAIAPSTRPGGANSSHTILVPALSRVLAAVEYRADAEAYERAVIEDNVLGKNTAESRQRTLRYLRELYLLRPDSILFRALRDLWIDEPAGQPLLAGLCALARDPLFRASAPAILDADPGDERDERGPRRGGRCCVPDRLQRRDAGQDRPQHLLVLGADGPPRVGRTDDEGPPARCLHAADDSSTRCSSATSRASLAQPCSTPSGHGLSTSRARI